MNIIQTQFYTFLEAVIDDSKLTHQIPKIIDAFKSTTLSKNEYLVKEGEVCNSFCFIGSGILQHSITVLGEEKTTYLGLKNSCTSALKSFLKCTPVRKNIKALSACDLLVIDANAFQQLLKENAAFHQFYYNLVENQIFLIDDYRTDLLILSPEERYQKLLANEPILLQQVPLRYLASFLGISDRHMSRIRKNVK